MKRGCAAAENPATGRAERLVVPAGHAAVCVRPGSPRDYGRWVVVPIPAEAAELDTMAAQARPLTVDSPAEDEQADYAHALESERLGREADRIILAATGLDPAQEPRG